MKQTEQYKRRRKRAKRIILFSKTTSTSYLQRKMRIGYNYADILMEDISKLQGFKFLYRERRKLLTHPIRKSVE